MTLHDIAKDSALVLLGSALVYLCGAEYYLSLFHDDRTGAIGVFFIVPLENALGEGAVVTLIMLAVSLTVAMIGAFVTETKRTSRRTWIEPLAIPLVCVIGWHLGWIGDKLGAPAVQYSLGFSIRGSATAIVMYLGRLWTSQVTTKKYVASTFATILFFISSAYYASLQGKAVVQRFSSRPTAAISFVDPNLETRYLNSRFVPLMEKGDDLIVLSIDEKSTAPSDLQVGHVVVLRRSLIRSVDFASTR